MHRSANSLTDVGQDLEGLEDIARHHRDVHVELERAVPAAPCDRGVVTDHLRGHLGNRLRDNRIDLARHDRAARLQVRQLNLAETGQRPGAHPADVVGDLGQRHRDRAQGARRLDQPVAGRLRLERVYGRAQFGQAGLVRQHLDDLLAESVGRVEPSADGGSADRQLTQPGKTSAHSFDAGFDLAGVAAELLTQGHRNGVHQVRTAGLDHGAPLAGLRLQ